MSGAAGSTLRPMRWTDLAQVEALEHRLFPDDAWSAAAWWGELAARPRRRYVVATDGATVYGYAGLDCAGNTADVMTVAVDPADQGHGIGGVLVRWMLHEATSSGAEALLLEVRADNGRARKLYDRNGFEQISIRRRYYQPGDVDALVMRALLPQGADR